MCSYFRRTMQDSYFFSWAALFLSVVVPPEPLVCIDRAHITNDIECSGIIVCEQNLWADGSFFPLLIFYFICHLSILLILSHTHSYFATTANSLDRSILQSNSIEKESHNFPSSLFGISLAWIWWKRHFITIRFYHYFWNITFTWYNTWPKEYLLKLQQRNSVASGRNLINSAKLHTVHINTKPSRFLLPIKKLSYQKNEASDLRNPHGNSFTCRQFMKHSVSVTIKIRWWNSLQ